MSELNQEPRPLSQNERGELSLRSTLGWALIGAAIFLLFLSFSEPDRGIVAAGSFACIAALVRVKWELRSLKWFWVFIAIVALVHMGAIIAFNGAIDFHPTILVAPLFIADFAILALLLAWLERKFARPEHV